MALQRGSNRAAPIKLYLFVLRLFFVGCLFVRTPAAVVICFVFFLAIFRFVPRS